MSTLPWSYWGLQGRAWTARDEQAGDTPRITPSDPVSPTTSPKGAATGEGSVREANTASGATLSGVAAVS